MVHLNEHTGPQTQVSFGMNDGLFLVTSQLFAAFCCYFSVGLKGLLWSKVNLKLTT